jgi:excisionase family DNA binding protein
MSSNIRLQKTCQHCGNRFTAKTTVTQFCSDHCAKRAYKKRKRDEKIEVAIKVETKKAMYDPAISQKEFLTVDEACQLINASRWTIYRLIDKGELKAGKLGRSTRIPRTAINELFKLTEA